MKYSIDIKGIHCSGCVGLIKMSLEELNLNEVIIDKDENIVDFKSEKSSIELTQLLDNVFSKDLESYHYSNLHIIT